MSAPFIDPASAAALGLSPWILPLIAIAAKRKQEQARDQGKPLGRWLGNQRPARSERRARNARSLRERIKAKMLGT